jgi:cytochrome bd ubiquinol oxidase subunit I
MPGSGLPNLGPQYILVPFVSQGWAVGFLFVIHVLIVAFIMGTGWILVFTGSMPLTPANARFERFTHMLARTLEQLYSFGATLAVFALTVLFGLFPRYIAVLTAALNAPLGVIFAAWLVMTLTLLVYYFTWNRLRPRRRRLHQSLILLYSIGETVFIVMIALYTSYQITPPQTPTLTAAFSNPTWFPEALHRVAGNLSYAGFLIAMWAAWMAYRRRRSGTSVDKSFYQWVGHVGFLWGLGFELAQLPIGTYYVFAIQSAGPIGAQTYSKMMLSGTTSQEWLLQLLLLSIMIVLADVYMWSTIRRELAVRRGRYALQRARQLAPAGRIAPLMAGQEDIARQDELTAELGEGLADQRPIRGVDRFAELWTGIGVWVLVVVGALAVFPDAVPVVGSMNFKWGTLAVFLVWSIVSIVLYVVVTRRVTWSVMPQAAVGALLVGGVVITLLMATMGVIRYTNPQTSFIERQAPLPNISVQSILSPKP